MNLWISSSMKFQAIAMNPIKMLIPNLHFSSRIQAVSKLVNSFSRDVDYSTHPTDILLQRVQNLALSRKVRAERCVSESDWEFCGERNWDSMTSRGSIRVDFNRTERFPHNKKPSVALSLLWKSKLSDVSRIISRKPKRDFTWTFVVGVCKLEFGFKFPRCHRKKHAKRFLTTSIKLNPTFAKRLTQTTLTLLVNNIDWSARHEPKFSLSFLFLSLIFVQPALPYKEHKKQLLTILHKHWAQSTSTCKYISSRIWFG